jgi:hypothetical protein
MERVINFISATNHSHALILGIASLFDQALDLLWLKDMRQVD